MSQSGAEVAKSLRSKRLYTIADDPFNIVSPPSRILFHDSVYSLLEELSALSSEKSVSAPAPNKAVTIHACLALARGANAATPLSTSREGGLGIGMSLSSLALACGEASEASVRSSRSCRHVTARDTGAGASPPLQRHMLLLRRLHRSTFLVTVHISPTSRRTTKKQHPACRMLPGRRLQQVPYMPSCELKKILNNLWRRDPRQVLGA